MPGDFHTRRSLLLGSLGPAAIERHARWTAKAKDATARAARAGAIVVDPAIHAKVAERMSRLAPTLARAFERHLVPVADRAQDAWPVATGLSRSLLSLEFREAGPGRFYARLANAAPYAAFIHRGQTADELVFRPGNEAVTRIAADVAEEG